VSQPVVSTKSTHIIGGRLKGFILQWKEITSDPMIITIVMGYKVEFLGPNPIQLGKVRPTVTNSDASLKLDSIIQEYLSRGIISPSQHELTEFISTVFLREKKNGYFRLIILNLKDFNKFVKHYHFKMDNIETCICLMKPKCFMASIDLRDAYFSVPIHPTHQKMLKFLWRGKLYQFTCLAQGLASAPRIFTKLLKPMYSGLRQK
jgi:hypothetical protein